MLKTQFIAYEPCLPLIRINLSRQFISRANISLRLDN